MAVEHYVRWGRGVLRLKASQDSLEVEAGNGSISLEARMIRVEAPVEEWRDVLQGKRRWVYVDLGEELEPLPGGRNATSRLLMLGLFDIRSTDIGVERYLTVVTPGHFIYDMVIVSSARIGVAAPMRRSFYFDRDEDSLTMYLV